MTRYAVILVVAMAFAISAVNAVPATEVLSDSVIAELKQTSVREAQVTTQRRSIFLGNQSKNQCWECLDSCGGFCCNDGFPWCCVVNGACRCCA